VVYTTCHTGSKAYKREIYCNRLCHLSIFIASYCFFCVSGCLRSLDVAFVLDLSSGDLDLIYRVSLPFIRQVADGLPLRPDRVRLAFVTAVDTPTVQFYFNTYRSIAGRFFAGIFRNLQPASRGGSRNLRKGAGAYPYLILLFRFLSSLPLSTPLSHRSRPP